VITPEPRGLLWRALRTRKNDLVTASVLYSTHQLGESMVPVIIGATIGKAVSHGSWGSIGRWLAILAADFAFLSLSWRFGSRVSMRAKQGTAHQVRMWLTSRAVDPAGGITLAPGDLLSRAASDADRIGAFAGIVARCVAAVTVLVFSTVLLLRYSLLLGGIVVVGTAILLAAQDRVARLLRRRSAAEQVSQGRATALAEDLIRGLRVLKGIGAEPAAAASYARASQDAARASLSSVSAEAALSVAGTALAGIYLTLIAAVGGWLALSGHLGIGELVSALGLAQFIIGPMQVVSSANAAYARALASAGRVAEVLAAGPAVRSSAVHADLTASGRLVLENVALDSRARVDATIESGSLTGLACGDPALAMALVALLARERDTDSGRILLDAVDVSVLPLEVARGLVLVSPHDAVLMPGTIEENLALLTADRDAIDAAAHAAFADQVIDVVAGGVSALVGDRGERLSGGQRQRIALARALAACPPVLVLHDPTTAVDAATEDQIADRVRNLRTGWTTLVITTSPAWLARCDQVVYLGVYSSAVAR
jgi:putative ABC transport system ATP-binding protein